MVPFVFVSVGDNVAHRKWMSSSKGEYEIFSKEMDISNNFRKIKLVNVNSAFPDKSDKFSYFHGEKSVYILINGNWDLNEHQRRILSAHNSSQLNRNELIPFLYNKGGHQALYGMLGEHNILVIDLSNSEITCISSHFGLLPLYYSIGDHDSFIVSSSLSLITMESDRELCKAAVAQTCIYNYSISDISLAKGVYIIPPASVLTYKAGKVAIEAYWNPTELLGKQSLGFKQGIEAVDAAMDIAVKRISKKTEKCAVSLTGGWDGRLVLSYLLKYKEKESILSYSFGVKDSPDVYIPENLCELIGLNYIPFILDSDYLSKHYVDSAKATALYSDGYRGIRKAHYYYTMSVLKQFSPVVATGICGSNIMKGVATTPSVVFNKYILELMSCTDVEKTLKKHYQEILRKSFGFFEEMSFGDFYTSVYNGLMPSILSIKDYTERFSTFLLSFTERKYFGPEVCSYRHHVTNFSPFIDHGFILALSKTMFYNCSKKSSTIYSNWQNSLLYASLVKKNSPFLASYLTDKGVTLSELRNPIMYPKIILKQYQRRKKSHKLQTDPYNTANVLTLFQEVLKMPHKEFKHLQVTDTRFLESLMSSLYWYKNMGDNWREK